MSGKYTPLEKYFTTLPASQQDVTLSFEQIERILNYNLPSSAERYQAWGNNELVGSHVQAHAWIDAGWHKDTVNFTQKWVRFQRMKNK